jgi:hypothetical protein
MAPFPARGASWNNFEYTVLELDVTRVPAVVVAVNAHESGMAAGPERLDDRRIGRIEPAIATEMPQVIAVIRLLILTGARVGELLQLKHHEVPRDEMELHLTDTKAGFSGRPLRSP